jgi:hypothetical protein
MKISSVKPGRHRIGGQGLAIPDNEGFLDPMDPMDPLAPTTLGISLRHVKSRDAVR